MIIRMTSTCCLVTVCAAVALAPALPSLAQTAAVTPSGAEAKAPPVTDEAAAAQALTLAQKRLNLTPEQTEKARPLVQAQVVKLRGLFQEYTGEGATVLPSFLQEFQKTRDDFRSSMFTILTEPQKSAFDQLRKEVDAALREEICTQRIALLKERLGLTPQQEAALRPILNDDFEKKRNLAVLHTSATGGPEARRPLNDEVRKVQAETETRLASVLTPEQMKTYRADRDAKAAAAH
jgi:Spy/CpxP family protein refolding chaperone